jgi:hypothetical protein
VVCDGILSKVEVRIDRWCAERRIDPQARVRPILQVCRAAVRATIGRLSIDLKPSNILVTTGMRTVKLLDFGIAEAHRDRRTG